MILRECISDVADGANAEAKEVRLPVCCVSLKIPMQRAVIAGRNQRISRPREVIHADVGSLYRFKSPSAVFM
jgi:hypothetical protein